MSTEYRVPTKDDMEQVFAVEALAFYSRPSPERVQLLTSLVPPEWLVAAFVDGKCVASVRTEPMVRRINGAGMGFGAIGPVACLSNYRRQGHVAALLRLSLEQMRETSMPLSGLFTPHDALYGRYGWERAEGRKRYEFKPKDVRLRFPGGAGRLERASADDWQRADAIYRQWAIPRNGTFERTETWWRHGILTEYGGDFKPRPREVFVFVNPQGRDEGYVVYINFEMAREERWPPTQIWVKEMVALTPDAYAGLWQHLLSHDLAAKLSIEVAPDDPFRELVVDPWKIDATVGEGAMLRVVDLERAFELRPYVGQQAVSFTMRVADRDAPWNDGVWLVEAAEGQTRATRTDSPPDVELTANTLAPLFTGYISPSTAAAVGLLKVHKATAIDEMERALAVTYPSYSLDNY